MLSNNDFPQLRSKNASMVHDNNGWDESNLKYIINLWK